MPSLQTLRTAEASGGLLTQLRQLLEAAFAGDFSGDDWDHTQGGWHVVAWADGVPLAHAAVVPRPLEVAGRRFRCGYVEGVATAPHRQREGLGSLVMGRASRLIRREFEMGALSTADPAFYQRLGWERWGGPTFVRHGNDLVRTQEEDDGIMVLRFGASRHVGLAEPLSCDRRSGDDW